MSCVGLQYFDSNIFSHFFILSAVYLSLNKFYIVYLSETFLNSETLPDDANLQIPDYSISLVDYPSNTKQALHKKWSFALWIYLVSVSKSTVFCGFGHIYWRNP